MGGVEIDSVDAMKTNTKSKLPAALVLALGLCMSASAFGDSTPAQRQREEENTRRNPVQATMDTAGNVFSRTGQIMKNTGRTVLRSPMIVGESLAGDRKFVSREGLFVRTESEEVEGGRAGRSVDSNEERPLMISKGRGEQLRVSEIRD